MRYLTLDGSDNVLSTYDGPAANAPAGAVSVTEATLAGLPFPCTGWKCVSGALVAPAAPPAPTLSQQAQAALAAGMQLASTGTPALNATYPCDAATFQQVAGIVAAIGAGLGLPGGGATFNWPDASGTPHAFTAASFSAFAKAMMNFLYALNAIVGSDSGTLPAQPVEIA